MTSGDVLSQWLQRQHGSVVQGSLVSLSRGGLLRVSDARSRPVRVVLPVVHGGQAAVARAVDQAGESLALRVQAVASDAEKARQMERLVNMTTVAQAARANPGRFPAVLPVLESFVLVVPGSEVPVTAPEPEYELWCDLMAWCPHDLNGWAGAVPVVSRQPGEVLGAFLPLLATVHAVHQDLGIVHRDITPNNVLVDEDGRLLLADWGIAHGLAAGQTSTYTQLVGNRGFCLPPEMVAGDPSVGRYTDAWYLGSLLVWMLTGQPPGPQHGPSWLPPGLPGGPVGDQVVAVVRGLCWPDPRGRMDLGQAQAVLTDAAAGRTSGHLTGPTSAAAVGPGGVGPGGVGPGGVGPGGVGSGGVGHGGVGPGGVGPGGVGPGGSGAATVSDPILGPTARFTGSQTGPYAVPAYGSPPPYGPTGPTSPQPYPAPMVAPAVGDRPSASRTWLRVAAAVVVVIVAAAALWGASRLLRGDDATPIASPTSDRAVPTKSSTAPGGAGSGQDGSSSGSSDQAATGPAYSEAYLPQALDALYEKTGGTQFTEILIYAGYVIGTAPSEPGAVTFDEFTWRGGKVTSRPEPIQPKPEDLFDATTVDWSLPEALVGRLPELTGVTNPDGAYVVVKRGIGGDLRFLVFTSDPYYSPSITADTSGNVTSMRGGKPGTPAGD